VAVNIDPKRTVEGSSIRWEVYSHGGRRPTGRDAVPWAQEMEKRGAGEIVLTSMDCDGTQAGYDLELTAAVSDAVEIPVVASGGAGCAADLIDAILVGHADAVLAASIFHFGACSIRAVKQAMQAKGIPVRL
jgi:cyclase